MISLYTAPSILALALKLTIFWLGRNSFQSASTWLWMFFVGLFGMNLSELATFYYLSQPSAGFFWLSTYYISAILAFVSLLGLSLENSKLDSLFSHIFLYLLLTTGFIPLLIPGLALSGVASIGYSITRIEGPYYFVTQLTILIPLIFSLVFSMFFSLRGHSHEIKRKSRILLISCLPIFISVFIIMAFMQMGYKINASVILSLMITFTLMMLVYTEHKEGAYKFMSLIPKTKEHRFVKKLSQIVSDPAIGLEQGRELIEGEMIKEALIITHGNKIKAAEILGISRQTLQRKLRKKS